MPMASCKEFQSFISDYIDGDISKSLKHELDLHLESCENCSHILKRTLTLKELLKNLKRVKTSSDFDVVLRKKLQGELNKLGENNPRRIFAFPLKPALGTLAGAAVLATVFTVVHFTGSQEAGQPENMQVIGDRTIGNQAGTQLNVPQLPVPSQGIGNIQKVNSRSVNFPSVPADSNKAELQKKKPNVKYVNKKNEN